MSNSARWQNRIVDYKVMRVGDLKANPQNWRTHPDGQRQALEGVLDTVGKVDAVLFNQRTGHLIDGHLRGELDEDEEWPVLIVDLDEDEERLILATFDPLSAMAVGDPDALAAILEQAREMPQVQDNAAAQVLLDRLELDYPTELDAAAYTFDALPSTAGGPPSPYGNFNLAVTSDQKQLILAWFEHVIGVSPSATSEEKSAALCEHIKDTWDGWENI